MRALLAEALGVVLHILTRQEAHHHAGGLEWRADLRQAVLALAGHSTTIIVGRAQVRAVTARHIRQAHDLALDRVALLYFGEALVGRFAGGTDIVDTVVGLFTRTEEDESESDRERGELGAHSGETELNDFSTKADRLMLK